MREVHWVGNPMAPKQGNALNKRNEGRGVTSARLRFWHDVCPYDPTKVLHANLLKDISISPN